ncbi:MAG: hypothetical protein ABIB61_00430 [Candidatus Shapirobacteria bacterium]
MRPKPYLYFLNAYNDAALAQDLVACFKNPKKKKNNPRVKEMLKLSKDNREKLLYFAYAQYYWNGLYDYLTSRISNAIFKKDKKATDFLDEFKKELGVDGALAEYHSNLIIAIKNFITPLFSTLVLGELANLENFEKKFKVKIKTKDKKEIVKAILEVQKLNKKSNKEYATLLKEDKKSRLLKIYYI